MFLELEDLKSIIINLQIRNSLIKSTSWCAIRLLLQLEELEETDEEAWEKVKNIIKV